MKIAIFEIEAREQEAFEGLESEHDLVFKNDRLNDKTIGQFADADVVSTFNHDATTCDDIKYRCWVASLANQCRHLR